ncbi:hypothetical protein BC835DRAFT_1425193 [Cytidiella melzeri]|nr:hypothetical protein BC835DRAFT_1425193 [Cytidiella melzeri]
MLPALFPTETLPRGAQEFANGYVLLHKQERRPHRISNAEAEAIIDFLRAADLVASDEWLCTPQVARWARLRLPTGQVARSLWIEEGRALNKIRISHNVKILSPAHEEDPSFAEVWYFFKSRLCDEEDEQALAMVDVYGPPDRNLLAESSNTLALARPASGKYNS